MYIKIMIIIISFLTDKMGRVAVVAKTFGLLKKCLSLNNTPADNNLYNLEAIMTDRHVTNEGWRLCFICYYVLYYLYSYCSTLLYANNMSQRQF